MNSVLSTALEGTVRIMQKQQVHANNLANLSTSGFRADYLSTMEAAENAAAGEKIDSQQWSSFESGPMMQTGRSLDVAINGEGWFAVLDDKGKEAYTRAGSFMVDQAGMLKTRDGHAVLSDAGPVVLPPFERVEVGSDGRITVKPQGARENALAEIGVLKLVNPAAADISKSQDGLFRRDVPDPLPADPAIRVSSGILEGSNVNAVKEMVSFIELGRQYEMQLKTMKSMENIGASGDKLLRA
ncbi:flagellar biosynthesis protein FlgF [Endozoicomonas sp. OPT23]|uniref:flagellar basal body rod protein FlgF n=1 Tax=Endozoicomonas sp. OPT23 TaxID=2072845 RepID=UPI00129BD689|nr:flagellar basal body rod protein FlgF [Endozoicomonas sp. OPT23]MRI33929.1 flagellar biosynthesis protein FlgF [Endozoicomonas sp. OPT23]